ncbi:MAG: hypothetical protein J5594_01995 [Elusimicrobiaceae bacterium]|nr:hypothetical protein [Elusimicrobiaceae bacterium]
MRNRLPYNFICLTLSFVFFASALVSGQRIKEDAEESSNKTSMIKKVSFNPVKRNPFLSKEEVIKIDQMKKAELRRLAEEEAERKRKAEEERKRILQQKILEEEMKRYPARAIMNKIKIDGILGREAIVNGEVVSVGSKVLGAKVVSITDDSVWFTYKGQRFERKLPLL